MTKTLLEILENEVEEEFNDNNSTIVMSLDSLSKEVENLELYVNGLKQRLVFEAIVLCCERFR